MIHVQTWRGACNGRITDMTSAGKRGKVCRVFRVMGMRYDVPADGPQNLRDAQSLQFEIFAILEKLQPAADYDEAVKAITDKVTAAALPSNTIELYNETIRGVDAPRTKLTAGVDGVWSGQVDEGGISLSDLTDRNNEPAMITRHDQKDSRAYELASKVWENVKTAKTFSEAGNILSAAGCRLHYYCRMD